MPDMGADTSSSATSKPDGPADPEPGKKRWNWTTIAAVVAALTSIGGTIANWHGIQQSREASQQQYESTIEQIKLATEGQDSVRLGAASQALASSDISNRIGGIHLFESLANEAPQYQYAIVEDLATFVQKYAPLVDPCPSSVAQDAQSALTVIGKFDTNSNFDRYAHLEGTCLNNVDLRGANLVATSFTNEANPGVLSNLYHANLSKANLTDATASAGVHFLDANMNGTILTGAHFPGVDLQNTDLRGSTLINTDLTGANLRGACLDNAHISKAKFKGADLTGASLGDLNRADFTGAIGVTPLTTASPRHAPCYNQ